MCWSTGGEKIWRKKKEKEPRDTWDMRWRWKNFVVEHLGPKVEYSGISHCVTLWREWSPHRFFENWSQAKREGTGEENGVGRSCLKTWCLYSERFLRVSLIPQVQVSSMASQDYTLRTLQWIFRCLVLGKTREPLGLQGDLASPS